MSAVLWLTLWSIGIFCIGAATGGVWVLQPYKRKLGAFADLTWSEGYAKALETCNIGFQLLKNSEMELAAYETLLSDQNKWAQDQLITARVVFGLKPEEGGEDGRPREEQSAVRSDEAQLHYPPGSAERG